VPSTSIEQMSSVEEDTHTSIKHVAMVMTKRPTFCIDGGGN